MHNVRYDRMAEEIKKTISEIIREMKDPRISAMTTIMNVEVTTDLKQAKVRVSVYDKDDAARQASVDALNYANGFISREIGKRMEIRALPKLKFILDNSIEYSVHISKIIDGLHSEQPEEQGNDADA